MAYTRKGKWARFWIIFGGPLANFIFAYVIYFFLVIAGEKVPQIKFGTLSQNSILHQSGVRVGDVLKNVNAQEISSFDDLNMVDSDVTKLVVDRQGRMVDIKMDIKGMKLIEEFSKTSKPLRAPILVNVKGESFLVKKAGAQILSLEELLNGAEQRLELHKFTTDIGVEFHPNSIDYTKLSKIEIANKSTWIETFQARGYFPRDLLVKNILMGSAAEKVKIKKGDLIIGVASQNIFSFDELKANIKALNEEKPIKLKIANTAGIKEVSVTPTFREYNGEKYLSVGVESGVSFYSFMVDIQSKGFFDSLGKAYRRTVEGTIKVFMGFKKLITGEVSLKHVGGPIAIGQVASQSFHISLSMFFRLMAIISINLGVINLFPIPVLDGGHLVFIGLEVLNRKPLSKKKLMYAQQVGMSLLFLLIFVALYNDIAKFF
ncbi:MAG: RIP metalloprotease RseP [Halobacteriovoraceae bacterium]|nr:RIP metalloprotease RseP [Halobacteriovoraceae bacterium]